MDKQYIGALYRKIGMDTSASVVEKQLQSVELLYPSLTHEQADDLVLLLFCGAVEISAMQWLVLPIQDLNPGVGSNGVDKDVEVLAAALLTEVIRGNTDFSEEICLTIEAASFFGKRNCVADDSILTLARDKLLAAQTQPGELLELDEDGFSDSEALFTSAESFATGNNLPELWKPLKTILSNGSREFQEAADIHLEKINEIIRHVRGIEEQNKTQWFAISKWSKTSNLSFSSLSCGEAATRAAFELGNIVKGTVGPAAAPALINMALSEVLGKDENRKISFPTLCTSSPIVWRKSWVKLEVREKFIRLTPVLAALSIANDASDESDWQARFKRAIGIDAEFDISPLDFALQLFHEILVSRM